jgi:adenosylcobinamide kinase / adenosylcobinamide-phosphate guanylyltransferase
MLTVITGGARSGKSRFADSLCRDATRVVYVATARPDDEEMRARIASHRELRPAAWVTVEEPIAVAEAAGRHIHSTDILLIDCVTLWLSNLVYEWRGEDLIAVGQKAQIQAAQLIEVAKRGNIVAVTNEIGSGIVPESPVARHFRDIQGLVNQQIAQAADVVYFVVSGIPTRIKPTAGVPQ